MKEKVEQPKVEENFEEETPTVEEQPQPTVEEPQIEKTSELEAPQTPSVEPSTAEEQKPLESPTVQQNEPQPNPLEELIKNLKDEIDALKQTNSELVNKVNDLSKQPSTKPISTAGGNVQNGNGDTFRAWRERMANML